MPLRFTAGLSHSRKIVEAVVMRITIAGPLFVLLACSPLCRAQSQPAFEAASVKHAESSRSMTQMTGGPGTSSPGQFNANAPLWSLVTRAYDVRPWQFTAPDWLRREKYEIVAKIPPGATKEQVNGMLQNLLKERFGLVVHKEMKELPIFELMIGKDAPKLKERRETRAGAPSEEPSGSTISTRGLPADKDGWPTLPADAKGIALGRSGGSSRYMFRAQPLAELVVILQNYGVMRPVIDKTGLTGVYDFDLTFTPGANSQPSAGEPVSPRNDPSWVAIDAVERLGLKLVSTKGPVEVLVVDRINKEPTEN